MQFKMHFRLGLLALVFVTASAAAQGYPAKPVRIVVTFSAGTSGDTLLRLISSRVSDSIRQQVVVDNRVGAGGLIGAVVAKSAPADGYTLLFTNEGMLINPLLMRQPPYDPVADLMPITLAATIPFVLAAHPSLPVTSVRALIALAKSRPGEIDYATGGTTQHLAMTMFSNAAGIKLNRVSYKGTGQAFSEVLGGQVPMMFAGVANAVPYAGSGRLRLLAVSSSTRSKALPDVPTMAEAGVPGYHYAVWLGYFAPKGTPQDIIARQQTEIVRVLGLAEVQQEFAKLGFEAVGNSTEEFTRQVSNESARIAKLIRDAGIPVQ